MLIYELDPWELNVAADASPHRCATMLSVVADPRVLVDYVPRTREYVTWLLKSPRRDESQAVQALFFCPWCGEKLPAALTEQLFDELVPEELAGDVEDLCEILEKAPERYRSDAWWKGRYDDEGKLIV